MIEAALVGVFNGRSRTDRKPAKHIFTNWKIIQGHNSALKLVERLIQFFEHLHSLAPLNTAPKLNAVSKFEVSNIFEDQSHLEHLERTLQRLRAPLRRARFAGAFLNVWSIAGLKRDETRNAAVLASLFDTQICPGIGSAFLWAFLQRLRRSSTSPLPNEAEVQAGYALRIEDYPLGYTDNRVDVSIEGHNFLLIVEVKIDAGEGHTQLKRYDTVLRAKAKLLGKRPALIYFSPRPPFDPPAETVYAKWSDVVSAARQVGRTNQSGDSSLVSSLLLHFAAHAAQFT